MFMKKVNFNIEQLHFVRPLKSADYRVQTVYIPLHRSHIKPFLVAIHPGKRSKPRKRGESMI
jgi:hypothetical protein